MWSTISDRVPRSCLSHFGFAKDPISRRVWKSLWRISRHFFSLVLRSTNSSRRAAIYHFFYYKSFILKIMQIYFLKKKKQDKDRRVFGIRVFRALVRIRIHCKKYLLVLKSSRLIGNLVDSTKGTNRNYTFIVKLNSRRDGTFQWR